MRTFHNLLFNIVLDLSIFVAASDDTCGFAYQGRQIITAFIKNSWL
jgi:hypothetical protein